MVGYSNDMARKGKSVLPNNFPSFVLDERNSSDSQMSDDNAKCAKCNTLFTELKIDVRGVHDKISLLRSKLETLSKWMKATEQNLLHVKIDSIRDVESAHRLLSENEAFQPQIVRHEVPVTSIIRLCTDLIRSQRMCTQESEILLLKSIKRKVHQRWQRILDLALSLETSLGDLIRQLGEKDFKSANRLAHLSSIWKRESSHFGLQDSKKSSTSGDIDFEKDILQLETLISSQKSILQKPKPQFLCSRHQQEALARPMSDYKPHSKCSDVINEFESHRQELRKKLSNIEEILDGKSSRPSSRLSHKLKTLKRTDSDEEVHQLIKESTFFKPPPPPEPPKPVAGYTLPCVFRCMNCGALQNIHLPNSSFPLDSAQLNRPMNGYPNGALNMSPTKPASSKRDNQQMPNNGVHNFDYPQILQGSPNLQNSYFSPDTSKSPFGFPPGAQIVVIPEGALNKEKTDEPLSSEQQAKVEEIIRKYTFEKNVKSASDRDAKLDAIIKKYSKMAVDELSDSIDDDDDEIIQIGKGKNQPLHSMRDNDLFASPSPIPHETSPDKHQSLREIEVSATAAAKWWDKVKKSKESPNPRDDYCQAEYPSRDRLQAARDDMNFSDQSTPPLSRKSYPAFNNENEKKKKKSKQKPNLSNPYDQSIKNLKGHFDFSDSDEDERPAHPTSLVHSQPLLSQPKFSQPLHSQPLVFDSDEDIISVPISRPTSLFANTPTSSVNKPTTPKSFTPRSDTPKLDESNLDSSDLKFDPYIPPLQGDSHISRPEDNVHKPSIKELHSLAIAADAGAKWMQKVALKKKRNLHTPIVTEPEDIIAAPTNRGNLHSAPPVRRSGRARTDSTSTTGSELPHFTGFSPSPVENANLQLVPSTGNQLESLQKTALTNVLNKQGTHGIHDGHGILNFGSVNMYFGNQMENFSTQLHNEAQTPPPTPKHR